ncbi:MAG: 30S ribosomal protein S16 [Proteobacteria bacterium]|nr:30S ribosomal protein S16 [Pseudomonadota bacterium]
MAVRIRLARTGAKKRPFYRLVAANSEAPRDGKFLEILGSYDPTKDPAKVNLHKEKVSYWLEKGATVTGSARGILKREGLLKGS